MKVKRAEASGLKKWSMVGRYAGLLSVIVLSGSLCASFAQTESAELKDSQHEDRQHKKVRDEIAYRSSFGSHVGAHCHRQPHLEDSP